jgi:hypothetical protein
MITNNIPTQGFEIVRDLIGTILYSNLLVQKTLKNLPDEINVFTGRTSPFQSSEKLMINIVSDSSAYNSFTEYNVQGSTNYFIDVFCTAAETESNTGGKLSTNKRDMYIGMIRYILQSTIYKTLQMTPGLVLGTYVEGFENFDSSNNQDASFVKMSRLTFSVRLNESQNLWEGVVISSIFTDVKLELTDLGYKFKEENINL